MKESTRSLYNSFYDMHKSNMVKTPSPRSHVPSYDEDDDESRVSETTVQKMGRLQRNNSRQISAYGRSPIHSYSSVSMGGVIDRLWESVACHSKHTSIDAISPAAHRHIHSGNSKAFDRHETPNTVTVTEEDDGIESTQAVEQNSDVIFENLDQMQEQAAPRLSRPLPPLPPSVPPPMPISNVAISPPPAPLHTMMMPMSALSPPVSLSQSQTPLISPSGSVSLASMSNHQILSLPNSNNLSTPLLSLQQQQLQLQQQIQMLQKQQLQLRQQQQQFSFTTSGSFLNSPTNSFSGSTSTFGGNINGNVSQINNFTGNNSNVITPNLSPASSFHMPPVSLPRQGSNPSLLPFSQPLPILNNVSALASLNSADTMLALALAGSLPTTTPPANTSGAANGSMTGSIRGSFGSNDNLLASQQQQRSQYLADEAAALERFAQDHARRKTRSIQTLPSQQATSYGNNRINVSRNNSNSIFGGDSSVQTISHSGVADRSNIRVMDNLDDYDLSEIGLNVRIDESDVYQHAPQQQHASPPPYHSTLSANANISYSSNPNNNSISMRHSNSNNNLSSTKSTSSSTNNNSNNNIDHSSTSNNEHLKKKLSKEESDFEAAIIASLQLETTRLQQELADSQAMQQALRDSIGTTGQVKLNNHNSRTSTPVRVPNVPSSSLPPSYEAAMSPLPPPYHSLDVSQHGQSISSNMTRPSSNIISRDYTALPPPSYENAVQQPPLRSSHQPHHKPSHRRTHSSSNVYKPSALQQSSSSDNEELFQQHRAYKKDLQYTRPIQSHHRRAQSDNALLSAAQLQQLHESQQSPPPSYHKILPRTRSQRMDEMIRQADREALERAEHRQHRMAPTSPGRSPRSKQHPAKHDFVHNDGSDPFPPKYTDSIPGKKYTETTEFSGYRGNESTTPIPIPISMETKSGNASHVSSQHPSPSSSCGNTAGHSILSMGGHLSGSNHKSNRVRFDFDEVEEGAPRSHSHNLAPPPPYSSCQSHNSHYHNKENCFKDSEKCSGLVAATSLPPPSYPGLSVPTAANYIITRSGHMPANRSDDMPPAYFSHQLDTNEWTANTLLSDRNVIAKDAMVSHTEKQITNSVTTREEATTELGMRSSSSGRGHVAERYVRAVSIHKQKELVQIVRPTRQASFNDKSNN